MVDCLIIGGGVVGLSLAYELAGRGRKVQVIDSQQPGRAASWAAAGILPPAFRLVEEPLAPLTTLSNELHIRWSESLLSGTDIDNGLRRCGGVYLARDAEEASRLEEFAVAARAKGVTVDRLSPHELTQLEPNLHSSTPFVAAYHVPDEYQLRSPRHLKALLAGCAQRGVTITANAAAREFEIRGDRMLAVVTDQGKFAAEQFCLASGSWSAEVGRQLGVTLQIRPLRGQIVLLKTAEPLLQRIVNDAKRYFVPRPDGRLLVGSTEEDAGFECFTTASAVSGLLAFACELAPQLAAAAVELSWAGLRPATVDGLPYLGRVGRLRNTFVASGHFRSGLQLSTGTALVMAEYMAGQPTAVDLTPFAVDRHAS